MKKAIALILTLAMSLSLAACSGGGSGSGAASNPPAASGGSSTSGTVSSGSASGAYADLEPVELTLADSAAVGAAGEIFDRLFAEKVEEITGGKMTVYLYLTGELGNDMDLLSQMQAGYIDLVGCQIAPVVSFVPEMAIFDLPMVFAQYDGETIDQVLNGDSQTHAAMSAAYEKVGLELLGIQQYATYRLTTANRELRKLGDFKNLQIRTMENSNHMAFWTAIGAAPTPLAWAEVFISLQNGTIDAQENAADTCASTNFQEVQKYLACTNHILYANQLSMNKEKYDSLDPAYQEAINQAVAEAIEEMKSQMVESDETNKQTLVDGGMTLIEYDDAFFQEILALDTVQALYDKIDADVNGLGTTLQEELAAAQG